MPKKTGTTKSGRAAKPRPAVRFRGGPAKLRPKSAHRRQTVAEIARRRAEAAVAEARKSHERLREALDILPQGIVFLDGEGRYILWNKKYAEIYNRSSDLFRPGARLEDTIRVGVARGGYPEAVGREEEWIAERLNKLYQPGEQHEQTLADGRVILIDERLTEDGGIIGLRVDITELKQREASFRLLFDSNPVPMIVCALDDERILGVNDAAIQHYGYSRSEFEKLTIRSLQAFDAELPWTCAGDEHAARTWKHIRADGTLIDLAIYSRQLVHGGRPAALLAPRLGSPSWPSMTISPACRIAICFGNRWTTSCCARGAAPKRWRCWCSAWTISRRSTIRSATASATSCCVASASVCVPCCARRIRWRGSTPTNSPSSRAG
jgi:PAS domain S-box-containing protein